MNWSEIFLVWIYKLTSRFSEQYFSSELVRKCEFGIWNSSQLVVCHPFFCETKTCSFMDAWWCGQISIFSSFLTKHRKLCYVKSLTYTRQGRWNQGGQGGHWRPLTLHSMAEGNLNKTEIPKTKTTTAWKLIALEIVINWYKIPPLCNKSTSKCECCEARFTFRRNSFWKFQCEVQKGDFDIFW